MLAPVYSVMVTNHINIKLCLLICIKLITIFIITIVTNIIYNQSNVCPRAPTNRNRVMFRCGRMRERRRSKRTSLRREYHGLRQHARVVFVPMQNRLRATEQLRVCRRERVQRRGLALSPARHVYELDREL